MEIPDEFLESVKNALNILIEAKDDKRHNEGDEITHEMEVGTVGEPNGSKFQIVLKLIVKEREFLSRGDIVSRSNPDRERIPYKKILPKN